MIGAADTASAADTVHRITDLFRLEFGERPTRIFRAPGRVNLIGEHTDYNDGFVMPVALQFCTYVAVTPRSDRILHVHSENFNESVSLDLGRAGNRCSFACDCRYSHELHRYRKVLSAGGA